MAFVSIMLSSGYTFTVYLYLTICLHLIKLSSKLVLKNVQFHYKMPVLCKDLGIFQFCIFGNNKANIRTFFTVSFVFFIVVRNRMFPITYETLIILFKKNFRSSSSIESSIA